MLSEPMTLYKLMNLYMLKKVNFPLTNAQLTDFFLQHEYASYFTLQQALGELKDSGLIHAESTHSTTRYEITKEGEETLHFFPIITSLPARTISSTVKFGKDVLRSLS